MNKHLRQERESAPAPKQSPIAAQPLAKPRSWKSALVTLAVVFAVYSFFGQFILPYRFQWSTISGNVIGGTEAAATTTSRDAKAEAAAATAYAAAKAEIDPHVEQAEKISTIQVQQQEKINKLELDLTAQKAPILADQAAQSAEATLYAQCIDRANAAAEDAAAHVAANKDGPGVTLAAIDARREIVSMNLRQQCDEAQKTREAIREQARANIPTESE